MYLLKTVHLGEYLKIKVYIYCRHNFIQKHFTYINMLSTSLNKTFTSSHGRHLVGTGGDMSPPPTFGRISDVIFTGLIRTTCSHSLPIFRYSEHIQYTENEWKRKSEPQ